MALVLVLADSEVPQEGLAAMLTAAGHEVLEAKGYAHALAMLQAVRPDVLLMDLASEADFAELRGLRSSSFAGRMPVVALVSDLDPDARAAGLNAGADDVLSKPVSPIELLARIRASLRARAHRGEESSPDSPAPLRDPTTGVRRHSDRAHHLLDGRYLMGRVLGEGGMATVYAGVHVPMGRAVAIKVLPVGAEAHADYARHLVMEAQLAGQLSHPNICQILDLGRLPNSTPYVVMERLWGKSLREHIATEGPLEVGFCVRIVMQLLSAVKAAHDLSILHRDIKPENIFLAEQSRGELVAKLLDFGLAKPLTRGGERVPCAVVGSPFHMAPEQVRGESADRRTDVYGCGVVLYEMVTGKKPFRATSMEGLRKAILEGRFPDPRTVRAGIPESLVSVLRGALAAEAARRFATAGEFLDRLAEIDLPVERVVAEYVVPPAVPC